MERTAGSGSAGIVARGRPRGRGVVGDARAVAVGLALGAAAAVGCARFNPAAYTDVSALYQASLRQFRHGRFQHAQEGFQKLSFELTARDSLFTLSRFYLAETYFGLGDFVTAAREFRRVSDEAPESPLAPTALLRAGDSYAALWRRPQLDPSNGQTALATWQELQGRYPDSEAAQLAYQRIRGLNEEFAQKDFETAMFYLRRGAYDSAILYFRNVIVTYPSASQVAESFVNLVRAYHAIGYREEERETCDHLAQYYPNRVDVREVCGDRRAGR